MPDDKKKSKKRARWDSPGKYRYIIRKLNQVLQTQHRIETTQRILVKGLWHQLEFPAEYIEEVVCREEMDLRILNELRGAGSGGLLPRDIAKRIGSKRLSPWDVTRRLRKVNSRLQEQLGQDAVTKVGMSWALTSFFQEAWGSTKKEVQDDAEIQ